MWSESFNIKTHYRLYRSESFDQLILRNNNRERGSSQQQVGDDPKHDDLLDARESISSQ